ncbi:Ig-like domain-containing protein, partial [Pseudomonas sp. yb_9]
MDNIVVADKQTEVATQSAWGNINLKGPGVVQMPVAPDKVATVTQRGQDLIITLKSGEKVTIGNFFAVDQAGVGSDIVFVGEDGTLWHAQYDATAFTGFTFEDVNSLDELVAGIGTAGSAMPTWAIAGLSLLGVGGAAAAADNGGGGSSGGGSDPDTTAPATPIDLLVSPDGLRLTGRGEAGTTVSIRDAAGNLIGSGTVGADGTFDVTLNPPQINSENLEVTLTDGAGNVSTPGTVTAPDVTAPLAPADLAINEQGTTLTGRAEPGATVSVRGADGVLLGSAVAGADGQFSITLQPPQTEGQALEVSAKDAAGNTSPSASISAPDVETPDTTAPDQPTNLALASGVTLTGRGEPGATVQVRDAAGNMIGTGLVGADGLFSVTLSPAQANGEALDIRLVDAAGNSSIPLEFTAPDITPPSAVSDILVGSGGLALSGRGEPGATVEVRDANGTVIGTGVVGANGTFLINLDPAVQPGDQLSLVQTDPSGNASVALEYDVPLTTAPDSPSNLAIDADGTTLTGTAPAGTRVEVHDANGTLIGSAFANPDGTFSIELNPPQANGELLDVVAIDDSGVSSLPAQISAPDITAPAAPTELAVSADGTVLTGRAEPGSTVRIVAADGTELGTAVVGPTGVFSINLNPPQVDGEVLQATATDAAGNTSTASSVTAPDIDGVDTTPPAAPADLVIGVAGSQLSGRGEAGTTVQVRDAAGNLLATGTVGPDGTFVVSLSPAVIDGSTLQVTLTDAAGNVSPSGAVTSADLLPPAQPTDLALADGVTFTGRGEPGATVQVRDAAGTLIGTGVVGADGLFSVTLNPAQANGEALDVRLVDAAGNTSAPLQFDAPDITAPAAPTELAVSANGSVITGRAEPGSTVRIVAADGTELGTAVVGPTGVFSINLNPPQVDGEVLQATATDAAGNTSTASSVTAPDIDGVDITPPAAPTDLVIGVAGSQLSGRGEAGTSVQVRDAAGNLLATGTVGPDGTFVVSLSPAVIDGSTLQVTLTDAAGNVSPSGAVTSADLLPPAQPTDLALADGVTFTGRGEPGATVQVRDAAGTVIGTGVVGADGLFSITLNPAQANGEALDVRLVDAAGNTSAPLQFDAPDIAPPAAVSNIVVGSGGLALSGRGEAGATVEVRDANGTVIGTGVVGANGTFLINLDPAVQPGDQLSLVQTDPSGNPSVALEYDVPLTTAPDSPSNLVIDADGTTLTGSAPAGTRVEVHDANGMLIGSAIANPDGTFSIELNPPQANGELLDVVAINDSGVSSLPAQISAPDITAPAAPTELAVSADGTVLTGRAEPGST